MTPIILVTTLIIVCAIRTYYINKKIHERYRENNIIKKHYDKTISDCKAINKLRRRP